MLNVTPHCITHTVNSCIYARDGICDDPRGKVGSKGNCKVGTDCQVSCPDISFKPPFLSSSYLPTHAPTSTTAYQNKEMSRSVLDFLCPFYSPLPFDLLLSLPYLNNRNHVILSWISCLFNYLQAALLYFCFLDIPTSYSYFTSAFLDRTVDLSELKTSLRVMTMANGRMMMTTGPLMMEVS